MKLPAGYVAGEGVKQANAYGGYGQRMLEKMGWESGQGLGKNKDGIAKAIDVKKKDDNAGIGKQNGWNWGLKYWEDAYNSAVGEVKHASSSDSDSSDSDEDQQPGRTQRVAEGRNHDGTMTSASREEMAITQALAKDGWGRWSGKAGKLARIREQEAALAAQAAARLGLAGAASAAPPAAGSGREGSGKEKAKGEKRRAQAEPGAAAAALTGPSAKEAKRRRKAAAAGDEAVDAGATTSGRSEQEQQQAKPRVIVIELREAVNRPAAAFVPTPATGWWGAKCFKSAGALEGLKPREAEQHNQRQVFNEDDQTALYAHTQDAKSVGRKGLGQSSTLKIAGGNWQGSKVTFGEEAAGEEEAAALPEARAVAASGQAGSADEAGAKAAGSRDKSGKLIKPVKALLGDAPGGKLKLAKLFRLLRRAGWLQQGEGEGGGSQGEKSGNGKQVVCVATLAAYLRRKGSSHGVALQRGDKYVSLSKLA